MPVVIEVKDVRCNQVCNEGMAYVVAKYERPNKYKTNASQEHYRSHYTNWLEHLEMDTDNS